MRYTTLRWAGILFPAVIVGFFESVRHYYLDPIIPGMLGNLVTMALVVAVTLFFFNRFFRVMDRVNHQLVVEQSKSALLQERNRMAREMHDGLSQSLFFLNIKLRSADRHVVEHAELEARKDLSEARSAVAHLYDRVRQIIFDLRTPSDGAWSLTEALKASLREIDEETPIRTSLDLSVSDPEALLAPECFHVLRIAQEALNNARRHADPSAIRVRLDVDDDAVCRLEVHDDGRGFDPLEAKLGEHFGLTMMRERSELIGGDLHISSQPGRGTSILLTVALSGANKQVSNIQGRSPE